MASRTERRRRITDFYVDGEVLQPAPGEVVFVQKINQFEDGEARADAQAARSRFTMALRRPDSPDTAALREAVKRMDQVALVRGIVNSRYTKYMAEASTALASDPEWVERLLVLDRSDIDSVRPDEAQVINELNTAYLATIQERVREAEEADTARLMAMAPEEVQRDYEESFIDSRAAAVYIGEYKLGQIAQSVRMCDATPPAEGEDWDHSACTHERLYVDEEIEDPETHEVKVKRAIEFVREEPDVLLDAYTRAFDNVHVAVRAAKDSASRQSSSEPSRPPSEEEGSAASTPEVSAPAQVGTSV